MSSEPGAGHPLPFRRRYVGRKSLPESGDEKPFRFELSRAQSWVAWRALDLGWKKQLHGEAERAFARGASRTEHRVERIGKKYQWIAYNELCGYLIDHHWYFSDWGDHVVPFNRVDDFESRDIDPTTWLNIGDEAKSGAGGVSLPTLKAFTTDLKAKNIEESMRWTKTLDDLLNPLEQIEALDMKNQRWWLTHLWYQDNDYLQKLQSENAFRTAQAAINMIIIRRTDLDKFVGAARGRNFGNDRMLTGGETAAIFVGEHSWDSGVISSGRCGKIELTREYSGIPYCLPTVRLTLKRGEYDLSTTIEKYITAPNDDLVGALKMHVEGPKAINFVTTKGQQVFVDSELANVGDNRIVVQAEELERVLAVQGLCPLWVFWSEKDGGLGRGPNYASHHDRASRTVFGGCFWRSDDSWKTSGVWLVDRG